MSQHYYYKEVTIPENNKNLNNYIVNTNKENCLSIKLSISYHKLNWTELNCSLVGNNKILHNGCKCGYKVWGGMEGKGDRKGEGKRECESDVRCIGDGMRRWREGSGRGVRGKGSERRGMGKRRSRWRGGGKGSGRGVAGEGKEGWNKAGKGMVRWKCRGKGMGGAQKLLLELRLWTTIYTVTAACASIRNPHWENFYHIKTSNHLVQCNNKRTFKNFDKQSKDKQ